jgi:glutathione S-transferase
MKLYYAALSGHAHRAHLFLSLLGIEHELVHVDMANGQHKSPEFLALNPLGQVPVLDDEGVVIADSNAILVYLAKKNGRHDWLPESPREAAAVQGWLSVAAGQIAYGPCAARLLTVFGYAFDASEVIARSHAILGHIDDALRDRNWIAADQPTIADVALYSYIARAPEGNVNLAAYAHVKHWLVRVEALPGFAPFQKTAAGLEADHA